MFDCFIFVNYAIFDVRFLFNLMDLCCDCVFDVGSGSNYADIMVIE